LVRKHPRTGWFYENVGYIHTTDVKRRGVTLLDLRHKVQLNAGLADIVICDETVASGSVDTK